MIRTVLLSAIAALGLAATASAAPTFIPSPMPGAPIGVGAIVPPGATIFFVSGIPGSATTGDTGAQTTEVLTKLGAVLKAQGFGYADVVNAKVYLVADPKLGKMDFMGMNTAFKTFFGTASEPNKPSRVTVQVAGLAAPGSLVEIELTAAK